MVGHNFLKMDEFPTFDDEEVHQYLGFPISVSQHELDIAQEIHDLDPILHQDYDFLDLFNDVVRRVEPIRIGAARENVYDVVNRGELQETLNLIRRRETVRRTVQNSRSRRPRVERGEPNLPMYGPRERRGRVRYQQPDLVVLNDLIPANEIDIMGSRYWDYVTPIYSRVVNPSVRNFYPALPIVNIEHPVYLYPGATFLHLLAALFLSSLPPENAMLRPMRVENLYNMLFIPNFNQRHFWMASTRLAQQRLGLPLFIGAGIRVMFTWTHPEEGTEHAFSTPTIWHTAEQIGTGNILYQAFLHSFQDRPNRGSDEEFDWRWVGEGFMVVEIIYTFDRQRYSREPSGPPREVPWEVYYGTLAGDIEDEPITIQEQFQVLLGDVNTTPLEVPEPPRIVPPRVEELQTEARSFLGENPILLQNALGNSNLGRVTRSRTRIGNRTNVRGLHRRMVNPSCWVEGKSLFLIPELNADCCFTAAFIFCGCRIYTHKSLGVGEYGEVESISSSTGAVYHRLSMDFFQKEEQEYLLAHDLGFLRRVGELIHLQVFQMEPFNTPDLSIPLVKQLLLKCCVYVHQYVEERCQESISKTCLEELLEAYSFAYGTHIHVCLKQCNGEKVATQAAVFSNTPNMERFIYMFQDREHMGSILSVREYFRRSPVYKMSEHYWCDYCCTHSSNRCLLSKKGVALAHQNECFSKKVLYITSKQEQYQQKQLDFFIKRNRVLYANQQGTYCFDCKALLGKDTFVCDLCGVNENHRVVSTRIGACSVCKTKVSKYHYNDHRCMMPLKKHVTKDIIPEEKIYVMDIESMQYRWTPMCKETFYELKHECILVCQKSVYGNTQVSFPTMSAYMEYILSAPEMRGATILAHNGGAYDYQFIIRYCEDNMLEYRSVARPNSRHKYLCVELVFEDPSNNIRFLDFMMMMPGSLKSIGLAFQLPVEKGDFPHLFSNPDHMEYNGRLPPIDSEEDWYGLRSKKEEEIHELKKHWKEMAEIYCLCDGECCCTKQKWNFRDQLLYYCWKDVEVLAGCVKAYRNSLLEFQQDESIHQWQAQKIDPFQFMTQAQIALALFLSGKENQDLWVSEERLPVHFNPKQLAWIRSKQQENSNPIHSLLTEIYEFWDPLTETYVTGYDRKSRMVYQFLDCEKFGCLQCHQEDDFCVSRGYSYKQVNFHTLSWIAELKEKYEVCIIWEHEWDQQVCPEDQLMQSRDFFYGGRCEVFSAFADTLGTDRELKHVDVCSLYPYVCSHKPLPIGIPNIYLKPNIDFSRLWGDHPEAYFGYVRLRIIPNKQDFIGVLPERKNGKLVYDLHEKVGCWSTEHIHLALEHGYQIVDVYEVWDWDQTQRSCELMKGYMGWFLRMKQESEGWEKLGGEIARQRGWGLVDWANLSEEQKDTIVNQLFEWNGNLGRLRKEHVRKNPVLRLLAKLFLNSLWGKLVQRPPKEEEKMLFSLVDYLLLINDPYIDQSSLQFRNMFGDVYKVKFCRKNNFSINSYLNIPVGAMVTSHGQCYLMRMMFQLGPERLLYCDTDSIMYIKYFTEKAITRSGLGGWEDEHPKQKFVRMYCIAPKCYIIVLMSGDEMHMEIKCKGVRLTACNVQKLTMDEIHSLVEKAFQGVYHYITTDTMVIHSNTNHSAAKYAEMFTRYGTKNVSTVYSKRVVKGADNFHLADYRVVRLFPEGYEGDLDHELK